MTEIPSYIPHEMVHDFDFDTLCREGDDPFLAASRMLDGPPMVYGTSVFFGRPAWLPTRACVDGGSFSPPGNLLQPACERFVGHVWRRPSAVEMGFN